MTTPICTIDATGIHVPSFADCLSYFTAQYAAIYGSDVITTPDTQDGQLLGILAAALNDTNAQCVAAYNSFSPSTAQGVGLSSVVKINGISRAVPSFGTVDLTIIGQAGAVITNGVVMDQNNNQWLLPASVVIPLPGVIVVTATAAQLGTINAPAGTVTTIATPSRGWQSAVNLNDAVPGQPVETDAALRLRQAISTAQPSVNILAGIVGGIAALPDVIAYRAYENDTWSTDANGIPAHSIAMVVEGGDAFAIAREIFTRKSTGGSTYGTTSETIVDPFGISHTVSFFRPTLVPITYNLTLKALRGFSTDIQSAVQQSISDWTNGLGIGNSLLLNRAYVPANLSGGISSGAYEVMALSVARNGAAPSVADVTIAFNELATCSPSSINVTVTT